MATRYGLLMVSFLSMQIVYGMENTIKEEAKNDKLLSPINKDDLPNLIGKPIIYQHSISSKQNSFTYQKGILGPKHFYSNSSINPSDTEYYTIYFNEHDKSKGVIRPVDKIFYATNEKK